MKTSKQLSEFDFSKPIGRKISNYKNKKLTYFVVFCLSLLGANSLYIAHNIWDKNGNTAWSFPILDRQISSMPESEFKLMQAHIIKNANTYNEKVKYIQSILLKLDVKNKNNYGENKAKGLENTILEEHIQANENIHIYSRTRDKLENKKVITYREADDFISAKLLYEVNALAIYSKTGLAIQKLEQSEGWHRDAVSVDKDYESKMKAIEDKIEKSFTPMSFKSKK